MVPESFLSEMPLSSRDLNKKYGPISQANSRNDGLPPFQKVALRVDVVVGFEVHQQTIENLRISD